MPSIRSTTGTEKDEHGEKEEEERESDDDDDDPIGFPGKGKD